MYGQAPAAGYSSGPQQTGQYRNLGGGPAPAYQPTVAQAPDKKPVMLLAALLSLIVAVVAVAGLAISGRLKNPVVGSQSAKLPTGPGVQMAQGTAAPAGPGVLGTTPGSPAPGAPITGTTPKDDGMAPPVTVSGGNGSPQGPSVVTSQGGPATPLGPNPIASPQPAPPRAPAVTGSPNQPAPVPQAPPAPPNNADFDLYLRWLRYVENERGTLRAQGETTSFRLIEGFYQTALGLADPDANDAMIQQQFNAQLQQTLNLTLNSIRAFRANITRTKPFVPADCRALDAYYLRAVDLEGQQTALLMDALMRKDIGRIKSIGRSGVASIDQNLGMSNRELERVYQQRGLNQQFRIQTGGNSSMLGGMIGLGGM